MKLSLNNSFSENLPADKILQNYRRHVIDACFSYVEPKKTTAPKLIHYSKEVLADLGLSEEDVESDLFLKIFSGNEVYPGSHPYAMCYGGHQFGNWAGQLGDGRAINLFELKHNNKQWAVQLKGAGETPYSRSADGLAVLRSSIREYLCSEAMHHLGIPTTRALSLSLSGDQVLRDMMYNGNPANEQGAIVCRVAESFVRFGSFEILSANNNVPVLKQLTDYVIANYYPKINSLGKQKYLDFLTAVRDKTIDMIVHWSRVGFVHGVMNTDNMSILGLTIDYGPYGWLDDCDYSFTPNTTDAEYKRYRFGNQAYIGMWNVFKLANAIYPLVEDADVLQDIVNSYQELYEKKYYQMMLTKLGLFKIADKTIVEQLEEVIHLTPTDYTIFFRTLSKVSKTDSSDKAIQKVREAFYESKALVDDILERWTIWFESYLSLLRIETISDTERLVQMNLINPKYIFRNYMAQLAIDQADKDEYSLIEEFYQLFKNPYEEQKGYEKWFAKRPNWAKNKVGCSMLSCSS